MAQGTIKTALVPPVSTQLTTLATVKDELGVPTNDNSKDARLTRLIAVASTAITRAMRKPLARQKVTEQFPSVRQTRLALQLKPIITIHEIRDLSSNSVVDVSRYTIDDRGAGLVVLKQNYWVSPYELELPSISQMKSPERSQPAWEIDYTGGYFLPSYTGTPNSDDVLLPGEIEQIALDYIRILDTGRPADVASESISGDVSFQYRKVDSDGLPEEIGMRVRAFAAIGCE